MKSIVPVVSIIFLLFTNITRGQVCPGGGSNFASAVSFDPAWIYGCNTGTSCNGGIAFDNRTACEPIVSMDACAPAPTCGSISKDASDIWFKFYATGPTAYISCFQNTSLVLGIQAFNGGPVCGSLTQLGCAISSGPSSGVQLSLSGLSAGTVYYFRVFGSATPVSQRTGLYCFCGSVGLGTFLILPVQIENLHAQEASMGITVDWRASAGNDHQKFELERSADGLVFTGVATISSSALPGPHSYQYNDGMPLNGNNYYRIKNVYPDGHYDYSKTISVTINVDSDFFIPANSVNQLLEVVVKNTTTLILSDISGQRLKKLLLQAGKNRIETSQLGNGLYLLQSANGGKSQKFLVNR